MRSIVSNATPLIYLAKIGKLNLLKIIFGDIIIPEEVKIEVVDKGKKLGEKDAYIIEQRIKDGWINVSSTKVLESPIGLEKGEIDALSLAKNLGQKEILVDEISARTAAKLLGLTPRGTLFVLMKALEIGELNLDEFLDTLSDLVRQGFRLKEEVYLEAVRKAREIVKE